VTPHADDRNAVQPVRDQYPRSAAPGARRFRDAFTGASGSRGPQFPSAASQIGNKKSMLAYRDAQGRTTAYSFAVT